MTIAARANVRRLLIESVTARVTPGAIVEVGSRDGVHWAEAAGGLTYAAASPHVTDATIYDLASLTKVIVTASLAMRAAASGALALDARIGDALAAFRGTAWSAATVEDLLQHCAGFPSHRSYYQSVAGAAAFTSAIAAEPSAYEARTKSAYTDLGFIVLGWLLEQAAGRSLSDEFRLFAGDALGDDTLGFGVPTDARICTAPTEADTWRGRVLVGEVHDPNAAALGGVAGHAGLFGTAASVGGFARWFMRLWHGAPGESAGVTSAVAARFATKGSVPGSSRALAWDTMLLTSSCGHFMSDQAIGHTGFTGTSLWIDPIQDLYVVILTNRVHPTGTTTGDGIRELRVAVHDVIASESRS